MVVNRTAENSLATLGAVLWCVQLLPQIWKSWREKSTYGLSPWLMIAWMVAMCFLATYNITQNLSIPLHIQPELCGFLCAFSWIQNLYYDHHVRKTYCVFCILVFCCLSAATQVGCVYALRAGIRNTVTWPIKMFGIIATILLGGALLPQIWEIIKRKEVVGLSIGFIFVDMLGGIFSAASLGFAPPPLDAFAASAYLVVVALEVLILFLAAILNPIAYYRRRRAIETPNKTSSSMEIVFHLKPDRNKLADLPHELELVQWF